MKVVDKRDRLAAAGATAVFVVHDPPELIAETMLAGLEVPFPVLVDLDRTAYDGWGLARTSTWRILLDPAVLRSYAGLLRRGERLRSAGADPGQLGGDFIVGPDGRVGYARPQRRDDRPPVGRLLAAVEEIAAGPHQPNAT